MWPFLTTQCEVVIHSLTSSLAHVNCLGRTCPIFSPLSPYPESSTGTGTSLVSSLLYLQHLQQLLPHTRLSNTCECMDGFSVEGFSHARSSAHESQILLDLYLSTYQRWESWLSTKIVLHSMKKMGKYFLAPKLVQIQIHTAWDSWF